MREIDLIALAEAGVEQARIDKLARAVQRASSAWRKHESFFTKSGAWKRRGVRYKTVSSSGERANRDLVGWRPAKYIPRENAVNRFERIAEEVLEG